MYYGTQYRVRLSSFGGIVFYIRDIILLGSTTKLNATHLFYKAPGVEAICLKVRKAGTLLLLSSNIRNNHLSHAKYRQKRPVFRAEKQRVFMEASLLENSAGVWRCAHQAFSLSAPPRVAAVVASPGRRCKAPHIMRGTSASGTLCLEFLGARGKIRLGARKARIQAHGVFSLVEDSTWLGLANLQLSATGSELELSTAWPSDWLVLLGP